MQYVRDKIRDICSIILRNRYALTKMRNVCSTNVHKEIIEYNGICKVIRFENVCLSCIYYILLPFIELK